MEDALNKMCPNIPVSNSLGIHTLLEMIWGNIEYFDINCISFNEKCYKIPKMYLKKYQNLFQKSKKLKNNRKNVLNIPNNN